MPAPLEIFASPFTVWRASAGTAKPLDLDAAPSGSWSKIGTRGSDGYDEDGVTLSHDEALSYFRGLGKTGRLKAWRQEEDPAVDFKVYDLTAEAMAIATGNTVTSTSAGASVSGAKSVNLAKGLTVATHALLIRSDAGSPYGDDYKTQLWIPLAVIDSVDTIEFKKGEPAGLAFSFAILQDDTNAFGEFRAQNAVKTS